MCGTVMNVRLVQYPSGFFLRHKDQNIFKLGKITKEKAEWYLKNWQGKFDVIYADPPWQYEHCISKSSAIETHYRTMDLQDICNLKIPAKENSVLFLWVPVPLIQQGFKVMNAWGFDYRTNMVWVKDKIGMGYYVRARHELLYIGVKGKGRIPAVTDKWQSVIFAPRLEHSKKPPILYDIIEGAYPDCKYLELFARNERENWISWGDEL